MLNYPAMFTTLLAFTFPAASTVVGWFVFGAVGTIAVAWGKLKEEWPPAVLGVGLMVYPYFFPSGVLFWVIGCLLTVLFLLPKRVVGF